MGFSDLAWMMAILNSIACVAPSYLGSLRWQRLRTSPQLLVGQCRVEGAAGLSAPRINAWHVESKLGDAQSAVGDGAREGGEEVWCGLCGDRGGWVTCGRCEGAGGFSTRPGLAGVKEKVGWARCKTCFGQTVVPCLFCGISEASEWKLWLQNARRRPHRSH